MNIPMAESALGGFTHINSIFEQKPSKGRTFSLLLFTLVSKYLLSQSKDWKIKNRSQILVKPLVTLNQVEGNDQKN